MSKFDGDDYEELLEYLVPGQKEGRGTALHERLNKDYQDWPPCGEFGEDGQMVVDTFREWLALFVEAAEDHDYAHPLFAGLAQIEEDWTFARYFLQLIKFMWV